MATSQLINTTHTMNKKPRLLIVEDDSIDAAFITKTLSAEYDLALAKTLKEAKDIMKSDFAYDMCILDATLPDGEGIEICHHIREDLHNFNTPIIMLTQRKDIGSKVASLGCGTDDYISKPFEPLELRARIKALFRRTKKNEELAQFEIGPFMIDRKTQRAYCKNPQTGGNDNLNLSQTEFRCLDLLASSEGQIFSREQILNSVWGANIHVCDRNVDSFISKLRRKCGPANCIKSRYGLGYTFSREE